MSRSRRTNGTSTGAGVRAPAAAAAALPDPEQLGITPAEKRKRQIVRKDIERLTRDVEDHSDPLGLGWSNQLAIKRATEIVLIWGYNPTALGKGPRGVALWRNIPGYDQIMIDGDIARSTVHEDPAQHADFFYVSVAIEVPADLRSTVREISQSITYYDLRSVVTAGCHFLGAGLATLSLVKQYVERSITLARAQHEYGRLIATLAGELGEAEKLLRQQEIGKEPSAKRVYSQALVQTYIEEEYVTGKRVFGN